MREYIVYAHKNLKNEKYYVGMTSQEPKKRWGNGWGYCDNSKMWKDIQESDWDVDWVHGILGKFTDKNEALKYEAFLIAMLDSARSGYNISTYGSNCYKRSEEHNKRISKSKTGEKNPNFGKHFSEEHKKKISDSKPKKSVLQFTNEGKFLAEYPSVMEAERITGCNHGNICECCKGKRKTAGGYIWKYA